MKVLDILTDSINPAPTVPVAPAGSRTAQGFEPGYYTVGDSHAYAIGMAKGWDNHKAVNGASSKDFSTNDVIKYIPAGSVVVISLGANDALKFPNESPETIAGRIKALVDASNAQGNKTIMVLFPIGPKDNKFYDRRVAVHKAIESAIPGLKRDLDGSPLQPDGVHATFNVYQQLANSIKNDPQTNIPAAGDKKDDKKTPDDKKSDTDNGKFSVTAPVGNVGPEMRDIQNTLAGLGYDIGPEGADGIEGKHTRAAIKKFQADNKLRVDGIAGQETVGVMNQMIAKSDSLSKLKKSTTADVKLKSGTAAGATNNAKLAVKFFISKGWTPEQAAGIVGNLQQESGANLDPHIIGTERDGSKAYGIAQWRLDRVDRFKKMYGKDLTQSTLEDQLNYVQWELTHTESKAGTELKKATTIEQAVAVVDAYYERSSGEARGRRISNAMALIQNSDSPVRTA